MDSSPVVVGGDGSSAPATSRWIEGVTAEMPLIAAFETILRQRRDVVLHLIPRATVYDPGDVEPIHKLRVAARRLSAVLDVFGEEVSECSWGRLSRVVVKIRHACGRARDLDVRRQFLEAMPSRSSAEEAQVLEILCDKLIEQRNGLQRKLGVRLLRCERELRDRSSELLDTLSKLRERTRTYERDFAEAGEQALLDELDALWSQGEGNCESSKALHRLRIVCKRLRYAAEIFFPVLDPCLRAHFYPQLEHIQELLGEIHDASVASDSLRKQRRKWRRRRRSGKWNGSGLAAFKKGTLHNVVDHILLAYAQISDRARGEFHDHWPDFSGEGFRQPVTEILSRAAGEPAEVSSTAAIPEYRIGARPLEPPGSGPATEISNETLSSPPAHNVVQAVLPVEGE